MSAIVLTEYLDCGVYDGFLLLYATGGNFGIDGNADCFLLRLFITLGDGVAEVMS